MKKSTKIILGLVGAAVGIYVLVVIVVAVRLRERLGEMEPPAKMVKRDYTPPSVGTGLDPAIVNDVQSEALAAHQRMLADDRKTVSEAYDKGEISQYEFGTATRGLSYLAQQAYAVPAEEAGKVQNPTLKSAMDDLRVALEAETVMPEPRQAPTPESTKAKIEAVIK